MASVVAVQEMISPRLQEAPSSPQQLPSLRVTSAACRVSLFGFIMDRSKLLSYWGETHVSPKEKSFISYGYPELVSITARVTWPSGLYLAALPMAS